MNNILVCELSDIIEEEVVIKVDGFNIICFANICPYKIEINKEYPADIGFTILDEWNIKEENSEESNIIHIGNGFKYYLYGRINEDTLEIKNIKFQDDIFLTDYAYLNGKFVSLLVDRITLEFL